MRLPRLLLALLLAPAAAAALLGGGAGCGPSSGANSANRIPLAQKWYERGLTSYKAGDFEDAHEASTAALQAAPNDQDLRLLGARVALARLDFADAVKLTEGMTRADAHGIRGRALWYAGDIEQAADELEAMLQDPTVKDPWAREVARLARQGGDRHPFAMEGPMVAAVEMPRAGPAFIVPCELEGEQVLAMVATGTGELIVDSNSRRDAAWVNLRFDRVEVRDVPALTQDLSALSRQLGAPIKALLGVNLLRHLHVTFDRRGDQFVVRREEPTAPPGATRLPLGYVRGGGMLVHAGFNAKAAESEVFLVDTSAILPLALEDDAWRRAGIDPSSLHPEPNLPNLKSGIIPLLRFGGFDLPQVPAASGGPVADLKPSLDIDITGVAGAGLLSLFRVTLGDEGRFAWLEPDPTLTSPEGDGRRGLPTGDPTGAATPDPLPAPGLGKGAPGTAPSGAVPPPAPPKPAGPAKTR